MPTGYTAGILGGDINTFEEFAKICARAFGATLHMRDENFSTKYVPDKVSSYYQKGIDTNNNNLIELSKKSDEDLQKEALDRYDEAKQRCLDKIVKINKDRDKLNEFLNLANDYVPPTEDHEAIKDFMIQQLTDTIKADCDTEYYDKELVGNHQLRKDLPNRNLRLEKLELINTSLAYDLKRNKEEIERVKGNNKWVEEFFKSIKP